MLFSDQNYETMPDPVKILSPLFLLLILNFIAPGTGWLSAQDMAKPFDNSHFITVDSVNFHFRTWNDSLKNPKGKVLLIHGFMASTFSWRENYDTLVKSNYKVIAVDLPGFGYSDRSLKVNQSQSNRARLLWDLLAELDQDDTTKWNLVGHSMGGGTAEAMALLHSERTKSLTIVDGMVFHKNENIQGAFVTASRNRQYNKIVSALVEKNVFTYNRVESLFKKNYGYIPDSTIVMGYLIPLMIEGSAESILSVFSNSREIINLDIHELEKIRVLVIWGEDDRTIKLKRGKRFVKNVPSAELKIIPGSRHDPMETHPKEFNGYMIMFLNTNNK
jgi:2-hydroxy-6-oxonona-2,4-dienedioate hydrolase